MPGSGKAPATDCTLTCMGNSSETCGGNWRLNMYQFGSTTGTTPSLSSSSTAPTLTPTAYTSAGCYTEATGIRALSMSTFFDDSMTVEACAAVCSGYIWFGVEYGREVRNDSQFVFIN